MNPQIPHYLSGRAACLLSLLLVPLSAALVPAVAGAGQFTVTPVRMFLTPQDRAIAVTVINEGDQQLVMQADVYSWKQKLNGDDDLVLTEDLILSPPIIKLAPKSQQVVRLARINREPSREQLTYRLIVRELPEAGPAPAGGNMQLQIALAFSLPVFITPPTAMRLVDCVVDRSAPDLVRAACENKGSAYAQFRDLVVNGAAGEKIAGAESGAYILPGTRRSFELKSAGGRIPAGKARLSITFDDMTSKSFDVAIPY